MRILFVLMVAGILLVSCRSTRKIQTAISKKDTTAVVVIDTLLTKEDSVAFIKEATTKLNAGFIDFTTFSGKINVDYQGADGKKYNVNANLRMYKDSVIWISVTAILGIEGLRAYITKDSVKIINKQDKEYIARSVNYLQDITALPLDLHSLQQILIGNPVFLNSDEIVTYSQSGGKTSLLAVGDWFRHLLTLNDKYKIENSKVDDVSNQRSRTCLLSYTGYENKKNVLFSTNRRIAVTEKSKLDIQLDFKSYEFNETLSFPFSIPRNYKKN